MTAAQRGPLIHINRPLQTRIGPRSMRWRRPCSRTAGSSTQSTSAES